MSDLMRHNRILDTGSEESVHKSESSNTIKHNRLTRPCSIPLKRSQNNSILAICYQCHSHP